MQQSIDIPAPPDAIWPFVADPVLMSTWNEKIVAVDRSGEADVVSGESFELIYRMSGRDRESAVTVTEVAAPARLVYRHVMLESGTPRDGWVDEIYELTPRGDGTHVRMTIDLRHSGMPWFVRMLIAWITRFGRPADPSKPEVLERLRDEVLALGSGEGADPA